MQGQDQGRLGDLPLARLLPTLPLPPQQPQRHLHQAVVEMGQHHVVAPSGKLVVKHYRPDFAGVWVGQTLGASHPTARQRR